ncbi:MULTISPECIES: type VI secretion system lipoprotein TssJ [Pseudomonas]|uniref:type VI secretion system lipoprotein TssJ n=1 Tax=Pseudomonas TaxID=286 RepID=UPI001BE74608|nr:MULTISPECIES: type VI secretion system lipoprotein TssJ [Pseudomonas]MBT2339764.1 type VI secretion system lipoprotein TssJ [Pseudomonas fluorescens]MCD4528550.1 type VI secretion system lipoprotein TssJ [Pseudomonas sp. C3-2018]
MSRTVINLLALAAVGLSLGGCGLTQSITDRSASTTQAIFHKQAKTLQLDFSARLADNSGRANSGALSVPTRVRVYQLSARKNMDQATYEGLLSDDERLLDSTLLDKRIVVVKPGEKTQLNVPLDKGTQAVAVAALFHDPDVTIDTWRLMLTRDEFALDRARVIELDDNRLTLSPLEKD